MDFYNQKILKYWNCQKLLTAHFLSCLFFFSTAFTIELRKLSEVRMHTGLMTLAVLAGF